MLTEGRWTGPPKRHSCSNDFFSYNGNGGNDVSSGPVQTNGCVDKSFKIGSPDFSTQINTNFTSFGKSKSVTTDPFDFSRFVKNNPASSSSDSLVGEHAVSPATPSVWSLDCSDRFVVLGCSSGRIEVWEIEAGAFQVNIIVTWIASDYHQIYRLKVTLLSLRENTKMQ
jgi:hypothetical protein